ncbi:DUF6339 family protein [Streptomyces sp. NPDC058611]|uniref:DUF6339 family protein n=1 Tax=unclassified Streptomyces TaxID=2593676 RepID=UPI00366570A9
MAYLYPRLLPKAAVSLRDECLGRAVEELRERAGVSHSALFYAATGGMRLPQQRLRALRESLVGSAIDRGYPASPARRQAAAFDIAAAEILHRESGIIPAEAVAGDLWAFLSLVVMPDVAAWRFPDLHRDRVLGTDVTRHVFGRLWWRAHLLHDEGADREDLYAALSVLGEAAFDQIYARRTSIGGSPHLVRAIVRTWEDVDVSHGDVAERVLLRDFLKRVRRLNAFISFDSLPAESLAEELQTLVVESVRAVAGGGGSGGSTRD